MSPATLRWMEEQQNFPTCTAVDANAGAVTIVRDAARIHNDVVAEVLQKQTVLQVVVHRGTVHVELWLRFYQTYSKHLPVTTFLIHALVVIERSDWIR